MQTPSAATLCVALAATFWQTAAPAQAIHRCGNSYGERPCSDAPPLALQDARTPQQRAEAQAAAARMARQADQLQKERQGLERQPTGTATAIGRPAPPPRPAAPVPRKSQAGKKGAAPEYFTARPFESRPARKPPPAKDGAPQ